MAKPSSIRPPLGTVTLWVVRTLALLAAAMSVYLTWTSVRDAPALGCGGGATIDCDAVLASGWSSWLGVPVAALGAATYSAIFLATWLVSLHNSRLARWGVALLVFFTTMAAGAAVWFIGLQLVEIGKLCQFCLIAHACGIATAAIVGTALVAAAYHARDQAQPVYHLQAALAVRSTTRDVVRNAPVVSGLRQFFVPFIAGLVSLIALVGGQLLVPAKTFEVAEAPQLSEAIDLSSPLGSGNEESNSTGRSNSNGAHTVRRLPPDANSTTFDNSQNDSATNRIASEGAPNAGTASDGIVNHTEGGTSDRANGFNDAKLDDENAVGNGGESSADGVAASGLFESDESDEATAATPIDLSGIGSEPTRNIELLKGQVRFNIYDQAVVGSPDAPHVIVELVDYTCPNCRKLHSMLTRARQRYGNQLAVVVMPVPLEIHCNKYVKRASPQHRGACKLSELSLAVAKLDPSMFNRFHAWLMEDEENSRAYDEALVGAYKRSGRQKDDLRRSLRTDQFEQRIENYIEIYRQLAAAWKGEKKIGLPILIAGDKLASGTFDEIDELYEFLETHALSKANTPDKSKI